MVSLGQTPWFQNLLLTVRHLRLTRPVHFRAELADVEIAKANSRLRVLSPQACTVVQKDSFYLGPQEEEICREESA